MNKSTGFSCLSKIEYMIYSYSIINSLPYSSQHKYTPLLDILNSQSLGCLWELEKDEPNHDLIGDLLTEHHSVLRDIL